MRDRDRPPPATATAAEVAYHATVAGASAALFGAWGVSP